MASRFHSTVFGQLVRTVSGNRLFKYPDEIDSLLWKKAVQPPSSKEEKSDTATNKADVEDPTLTNQIIDDGKDIFVVGWYGQDDPEVCFYIPVITGLPV